MVKGDAKFPQLEGGGQEHCVHAEDAVRSSAAICACASGKADDGSAVAGKGVRKLIGFFNGVRSQETKVAIEDPGSAQSDVHEFHDSDVGKGVEITLGSFGCDPDDGLVHGDHGLDHGDQGDQSAGMMCGSDFEDGSDHGDLSAGMSCGYDFEEGSEQGEQSAATMVSDTQGTFDSSAQEIHTGQESKDLDKENNVSEREPKWRILARRAGARTAERAELIAQRLSDRFEQLRGDDEGMPNWQQHMVDELNTFLAWIAHCQTEECTFEDYQGWRPPLRPRRRRKQ